MANSRMTDAELERQIDAAETLATKNRAEGLWATSAQYNRKAGRIFVILANGMRSAF